jgi:hypothetical protein
VQGWVDDQWVLLCYDAKNKLIYLDPKFEFVKPSVQLKVICEDNMGNVSTTFFSVMKPSAADSKK